MKYLIPATILLFLLSWGAGSSNCGLAELFLLLRGQPLTEHCRVVFLEMRLPRLLAAVLAGGMLAGAGAASQHLFRNDLASPHVLGVINSAALGAVCGLLLGRGLQTPLSISFGLLSLLLLILPGRRWNWSAATLILSGIAVNALAAALTSGALFLAEERLASLVFWMLGGLWRTGWREVLLLLSVALPCWSLLYFYARELDLLLLGDRMAELSGLRLKALKPVLLLCIAALSATVVSCCGVIGFVGLAVPHIVRIFCGASFRQLLPASIVSGAFLLLAADLLARTMFAPLELPLGILTALCGAPFFFWLLIRKGAKNAM